MDAHIGSTVWVKKNGINRAGFSTLAATDAQVTFHLYAAALALRVGTRGAGIDARSRVASEADLRLKPCAQTTGTFNANPCRVPRHFFMHQTRTGERAGMAPDAPLHAHCFELFHVIYA